MIDFENFKELVFPDEFLWGTATSAHQVEGNNRFNDWWRFEQQPGNVVNGDKSGLACDHYHRFREDFALIHNWGHSAHRISIEWSRIQPQENAWNDAEIKHYREVLQTLRNYGMKTFVTLHHFTSPLWIADSGGFLNEENIEKFAQFAEKIAREFKDLVDYWTPVNEPNILALNGYYQGYFPPKFTDLNKTLQVYRNTMLAHARAFQAIKKGAGQQAIVGPAHATVTFRPQSQHSSLDQHFANLYDWVHNEAFFHFLRTGWISLPFMQEEKFPEFVNTYDFIGINYYLFQRVSAHAPDLKGRDFQNEYHTQMGWPIWPEGLLENLHRFRSDNKPLFITENGISTADDSIRIRYIAGHLNALHQALQEGLDVRGYLYWSLMDNFEWSNGFYPRFGLIEIDYQTLERKPRPSAYFYSDIVKNGCLNKELISKYLVQP